MRVFKYLIPVLLCVLLSAQTAAAYLTYVETHKNSDAGVDGLNGAYDVVVSPDNKYLYAAGYSNNAIAVFSRDTSTGALTFVEAVIDDNDKFDGFNCTTSVFVSPDGNHVYATGESDDAIAIFKRDTGTGKISDSDNMKISVAGLDGASSVTVSPDDDHVYATGKNAGTLVVFSRDTQAGTLTLLDTIEDVSGLSYPRKVVVSPDGNNVYVACEGNAVVVFNRDTVTGAVSWAQTIENGIAVDDALKSVWDIAVSPDHTHVYTAASTSGAVAMFERNLITGELTYLGRKKQDDTELTYHTVDGISSTTSVTVSPDGKFVVASGKSSKGIAVFQRDTDSGLLTWREAQKDTATGGTIDGLNKAKDVTFSPDGLHVYAVADSTDHAVTVFDAGPVTAPPGETGYYRLAFLTSTLRDGSSPDIEDYNSFVQNLAASQSELDDLNTTWTAIVSTTAGDARDNTATTGIGVPIYRMDGYKIADNYGDLWDGTIAKALDVHENGIQYLLGDPDGHAYTGTDTDGTKVPEAEVGGSDPKIGSSWDADNGWIGSTENNNNTDLMRIYAISGVLPAPAAPGAPTIGSATVAGGQVEVSFTPPTADNGSAITAYTATSSPGGITGSNTGSPITVTGLTYGATYTFTVSATSAAGTGNDSGASNSIYYGLWYQDSDGDGYGDPAISTGPADTQPAGYITDNSDCDDTNAGIHPAASEILDNNIDENCDGVLGQSPSQPVLPVLTIYADVDGDGFGDPSSSLDTTSLPPGYVLNSSDCNDGDAAIWPGAPEIPGDGIDQDCDGKDLKTWYLDADQDGFGDPATPLDAEEAPTGYVSDYTDCNDGDAAVYPGAPETAGDLKDQDCDGQDTPLAFIGTLEATPLSGLAPVAVDFTTLVAQGTSPFTFTYDFGDGSPTQTGGSNISHTFQTKGTFTVEVTVTDAAGAFADLAVTVEVVDQGDLDDLKSQLIIDADQVDQTTLPEELPGILADAQEVIDKSLTAVSTADPATKKEIQDTIRDEAATLLSNTKTKLTDFIAADQIDPAEITDTLAGVEDVVSNMVKNDVAVTENTLSDLQDISGEIFSASADTLLKDENLTPDQVNGIKSDPAAAQDYFTSNPHLLDDVVAASGVGIDVVAGFNAQDIQQAANTQGLDEKQTAELFNAVEPTPDVEKTVVLAKAAAKTIAEIAVEILDTYYPGKSLSQFTLEPITKNLLIQFADDTYISFLISDVSIVEDFVPLGLFFLPDGSVLGTKDGYAITFTPYPVFPFDFTAEVLKLGMTPQLTGDGDLNVTFAAGQLLSMGVAWQAFPTNSFKDLTTSFSVVGGDNPAAEAYSLLVNYDTGLSQLVPPAVMAMDLMIEMLNALLPGTYAFNNNTGVVTISNVKLKPDYMFTTMKTINYPDIETKGGIVYKNKLGIAFDDYNADGLQDFGVYSNTPKGFQVLYGLN